MSLASFSLVLGVLCYVLGIPMVAGDRSHLSWRRKFLADANNIRLLSVLALSISVATLKYQWEITPDGEGLMVLIVWLGLLEGALMALVPAWYVRMKGQMTRALMNKESGKLFWGIVSVLAGAFFTYMGFVLA